MPKRNLKKKFSFSSFKPSPLTFFVIGFLLICFSLYWSYYEKTVLSFDSIPLPVTSTSNNKPVKLIIPSRFINIDVSEASAINDIWQINPEGVSHLTESSAPGQKGNIVIYGHNKTEILGSILWMHKGEEIKITDDKGKNHSYIVEEILTVNPSDVWVLNKTNEEALILYTCTGLFDSKRFVIKAKPVS